MAVTSMWAVKSRLDHVIEYASDEEKTMHNVIDYTTQDVKTNEQYITCINCPSNNPYGAMMQTKENFNDHKQRLAYHGYQSFKPGEGTPEVIHEIGVRTIKELFGNEFEAIVTTHLDKEYLHNHFIINATSCLNGKRFCNTKHDRYLLRQVSDKLCREYGLSVIENPQLNIRNKRDYNANRTFIREIKKDFDYAISSSFTNEQVKEIMLLKGYEFKMVSGVECVYHPNYDKPIALKMLGDNYSIERILDEGSNYNQCYFTKKYKVNHEDRLYSLFKQRKLSGFQLCYVRWLVASKILPNHHITNKPLSKETKQALKKLDVISASVNMLFKNDIKTIDELYNHQSSLQQELDDLLPQRKYCYYQRSKTDDPVRKKNYQSKLKNLHQELRSYVYS